MDTARVGTSGACVVAHLDPMLMRNQKESFYREEGWEGKERKGKGTDFR